MGTKAQSRRTQNNFSMKKTFPSLQSRARQVLLIRGLVWFFLDRLLAGNIQILQHRLYKGGCYQLFYCPVKTPHIFTVRFRIFVMDCILVLTDCILVLTDCNLVLTDCNLVLTDCNLVLTDCYFVLMYCNMYLVDCDTVPRDYMECAY